MKIEFIFYGNFWGLKCPIFFDFRWWIFGEKHKYLSPNLPILHEILNHFLIRETKTKWKQVKSCILNRVFCYFSPGMRNLYWKTRLFVRLRVLFSWNDLKYQPVSSPDYLMTFWQINIISENIDTGPRAGVLRLLLWMYGPSWRRMPAGVVISEKPITQTIYY